MPVHAASALFASSGERTPWRLTTTIFTSLPVGGV